jgi:hypothetical protein
VEEETIEMRYEVVRVKRPQMFGVGVSEERGRGEIGWRERSGGVKEREGELCQCVGHIKQAFPHLLFQWIIGRRDVSMTRAKSFGIPCLRIAAVTAATACGDEAIVMPSVVSP